MAKNEPHDTRLVVYEAPPPPAVWRWKLVAANNETIAVDGEPDGFVDKFSAIRAAETMLETVRSGGEVEVVIENPG